MGQPVIKSGLVSVVGRPNVGKSSLVNALVDHEISITSVHPHTTRTQIRAIDNAENYQIVYVDTPGIHKPKTSFGEKMNDVAYDSLAGVDIIIAVFDATKKIGTGDKYVAEQLAGKENVFVVLNKCDVLQNVTAIAARAQEVSALLPDAQHIFVVSAFTKKNVHLVKSEILNALPAGVALFEQDRMTDMSDQTLVSEIYREQLIRKLKEELPQGLTVVAVEEESEGSKREFNVNVIVSSKSHKPIVIGKAGSMLENVGTLARAKIEALLGEPIILRVHVDIDENWQSKTEYLNQYFF